MPPEEIKRIKKIAKLVWFIHENQGRLKVEDIENGYEIIYFGDYPDVFGVGADRIDSINDLAETLLYCYEEYAECDESELDACALELREWLLQNLKQPLTN